MKYLIDSSTLTDIADAIREKTGSTDSILVSGLAQAITDLPSGGSSYFYQQYTSDSTVSLNGNKVDIPLDVDDVDWLIMFPLQTDSGSQYSWTGGVYIPNVFGAGGRTSYGVSTFSSIGCGSGSNITVTNGVLSIVMSQNCYLNANIPYGIVGKAKEN